MSGSGNSSSGSQPLAYIDTNVFSYLLLPYKESQNLDHLVEQANKFAGEIVDGTFIGLTSTFTETEYRSLSKRKISEKKKSQIAPQEEAAAMDDFSRMIDALGIGLVDADKVAPEISGKLKIFSGCGDTVRRSNPVPIKEGKGCKWRMISSVDVLMVN